MYRLISALIVCMFLLFGSAYAEERPNIVFIYTDDLGWGDLGCYGNNEIKTPNIDALAEEGTLFTQFYVGSPVCSPSRAAVITGQYPARNRIHGHLSGPAQNAERDMPGWLDPNVDTFVKHLQKAGYKTGHLGKWHLGMFYTKAPELSEYGFDDWGGFWTPSKTLGHKEGDPYFGEPYFWHRSTDFLVDEAIKFVESAKDQPFYLQVWTVLPHTILDPPKEAMEQYKHFGMNKPYFSEEKEMTPTVQEIYYSTVTAIDNAVGRLLDSLDDMGLSDNTIIIFSSDNGPEEIALAKISGNAGIGSAGPFRGRKRSLYEGGVRVPFIAKWPEKIKEGAVDNTSVITAVDLFPTLCALANVDLKTSSQLDGEDVSDIILGNTRARTKPIFWEWRYHIFGHVLHRSPMLAIREGDWKLLMNPDRSRVELYNIPNDATELNNLASQKPQLVKELSAKLMAWKATLPESYVENSAGKNNYPWPKSD